MAYLKKVSSAYDLFYSVSRVVKYPDTCLLTGMKESTYFFTIDPSLDMKMISRELRKYKIECRQTYSDCVRISWNDDVDLKGLEKFNLD